MEFSEFINCCEYGDIKRLKSFTNNDYLDFGLREACIYDHMDVVLFLIGRGADNWNDGLEGACIGGNETLVSIDDIKGC